MRWQRFGSRRPKKRVWPFRGRAVCNYDFYQTQSKSIFVGDCGIQNEYGSLDEDGIGEGILSDEIETTATGEKEVEEEIIFLTSNAFHELDTINCIKIFLFFCTILTFALTSFESSCEMYFLRELKIEILSS